MFTFTKKKTDHEQDFLRSLIQRLEKVYEVNANYGFTGNGYLEGDSEIEKAINKLLELKNTQVREQFLLNSELIEFVTQMSYVKEMVDYITLQKQSVSDVAISSKEMSESIEEVASYVQASLNSTKDAISTSSNSLDTINISLDYINRSFEEINTVQHKMENVVDGTKEINNVVNIINSVADQTNLLAINAGIEAARSGEAGKGFAVVATEIKKLAVNTKSSATYIKNLVEKLQEEIEVSERAIQTAVDVFTDGKKHIDRTIHSIDEMEGSLESIGAIFESISANIEEQSATTQEVSNKLGEINEQTLLLTEVCMKTGRGIYSISERLENQRNKALPYFKDLKPNQVTIPVAAEHLLWKWKAYNVVCGFTQINENQIQDHHSCRLGMYLNSLKQTNPNNEQYLKQYEPHKKVHSLTKEIIRQVNCGNTNKIPEYIKELDDVTAELTSALKMV